MSHPNPRFDCDNCYDYDNYEDMDIDRFNIDDNKEDMDYERY